MGDGGEDFLMVKVVIRSPMEIYMMDSLRMV
jgi:hypothetical protein